MNQLNKSGIEIIKNFEGLRLKAYRDIAGVWTIGYGCTQKTNGIKVKRNDELKNDEEAQALLINVLSIYINVVNTYCRVPLNQNQFNSLVSFVYNVGTGAFQKSTLLRKLNSNDYQGAADQLLVWNKITDPTSAKKVVSKTLTNRRKQERELFLKPIQHDNF